MLSSMGYASAGRPYPRGATAAEAPYLPATAGRSYAAGGSYVPGVVSAKALRLSNAAPAEVSHLPDVAPAERSQLPSAAAAGGSYAADGSYPQGITAAEASCLPGVAAAERP